MKRKIFLLMVAILISPLLFAKSYAPVVVTHEVLQQVNDDHFIVRIRIEIMEDLNFFSAQIEANKGLSLIEPIAAIDKSNLSRGYIEEFDATIRLHESVAYLAVIIQTKNRYGVPLAKSAVLKISDSTGSARQQFKNRTTGDLKLMPGSPR